MSSHVLLAACREEEQAHEDPEASPPSGVFSTALLQCLIVAALSANPRLASSEFRMLLHRLFEDINSRSIFSTLLSLSLSLLLYTLLYYSSSTNPPP